MQNAEFGGTISELIEDRVKTYCLIMGFVALASGVGCALQKISFSYLGGGVTYEIRQLLYEQILRKHTGWFDQRDHASGVLTKTMAHDTSVINGMATESLAPQVEGSCSFLLGVIIAFIACWQEALVCVAVSPIMSIGKKVGI